MRNSGVHRPLNIIFALPESDFFKKFVTNLISVHPIENIGFAEMLGDAFSLAVDLDSNLVVIDDSFFEDAYIQLNYEINRVRYEGITIVLFDEDKVSLDSFDTMENVFFIDRSTVEGVISQLELVIRHGLNEVTTKTRLLSNYDYSDVPIDIYRQATKILINCGFNSKHKGFIYIRDASIIRALDDNVSSLSKNVYPNIANKYNVSEESVERAIRHAIYHVWYLNKLEPLSEFGMNYRFNSRPTNSVIISYISEILKELNS